MMIEGLLQKLRDDYDHEGGLIVTPFIPEGERLAERTFNPRVGVMGGLSVLGTSGRVIPYSTEAFLASLREQMVVARENGCTELVATSGRRSEMILRKQFLHLPDLAFIHYGNLVGETLKLCNELSFRKLTLGMMPGKAIKLAEGHLNTHSRHTSFDPEFAASLAEACGYPDQVTEAVRNLKLANAIAGYIPFSQDEPFYLLVTGKCTAVCRSVLSPRVLFRFILIS